MVLTRFKFVEPPRLGVLEAMNIWDVPPYNLVDGFLSFGGSVHLQLHARCTSAKIHGIISKERTVPRSEHITHI
jgi:hypothetical protein